jgi:hypothetical protein
MVEGRKEVVVRRDINRKESVVRGPFRTKRQKTAIKIVIAYVERH